MQSGNVTVQNLTITEALAGGGDGGSGIAAGGGGAGLGGGLFVGAAATVGLNNVNFSKDVAAGGNGGNIDTTATAGGGGGGMGGAGGDAVNTTSQYILNVAEMFGGYDPPFNTSVDTLVGAGGAGLGTTASGSSVLNGNGGQGDAPGEASGGGGGGGQTENYEKTYYYGAYTTEGTDTSPSTGGGAYGGGGGFGNSEYSGGGGGGIGGQTSANFNTGNTIVVDQTSEFESILDDIYKVAKIVLPLVQPEFGVAFAAIQLATDITSVAESGGFNVADGVELGTDAANLFVAAKAAYAANQAVEVADEASSLPTTVRTRAPT